MLIYFPSLVLSLSEVAFSEPARSMRLYEKRMRETQQCRVSIDIPVLKSARSVLLLLVVSGRLVRVFVFHSILASDDR